MAKTVDDKKELTQDQAIVFFGSLLLFALSRFSCQTPPMRPMNESEAACTAKELLQKARGA